MLACWVETPYTLAERVLTLSCSQHPNFDLSYALLNLSLPFLVVNCPDPFLFHCCLCLVWTANSCSQTGRTPLLFILTKDAIQRCCICASMDMSVLVALKKSKTFDWKCPVNYLTALHMHHYNYWNPPYGAVLLQYSRPIPDNMQSGASESPDSEKNMLQYFTWNSFQGKERSAQSYIPH